MLCEISQLLLGLEQLEHFGQAKHANKFVKLTDPGETHHHGCLLLVLILHQCNVKWQDGNEIDPEPAF